MARNILLLTNHGNEPYLLGIKVALRSGAERICVPHYYHGRYGEPDQLRIIQEEFPDDCEKIFLSERLGNILKPILRSSQDNRSYPQYINEIYKNRNSDFGINRVYFNLGKIINRGISTYSASKDTKNYKFLIGDFDCALNIGLPIDSPIKPTHYIFTCIFSQLYRTSINETDINELKKYEYLAEYWDEIERKFSKKFIPSLNALSHVNYRNPDVIYTPPLANRLKQGSDRLKNESILIIPSGTGRDKKYIDSLFSKKTNFHWVSYSPKIKHGRKVTPSVFSDKLLLAVISRGGWGTIWKCLVHSKPMGLFKTNFDDDPEIAHTIKTLLTLNFGFLLDMDLGTINFPDNDELGYFSENIYQVVNNDTEKYYIGSIDYKNDGVGYISAQL